MRTASPLTVLLLLGCAPVAVQPSPAARANPPSLSSLRLIVGQPYQAGAPDSVTAVLAQALTTHGRQVVPADAVDPTAVNLLVSRRQLRSPHPLVPPAGPLPPQPPIIVPELDQQVWIAGEQAYALKEQWEQQPRIGAPAVDAPSARPEAPTEIWRVVLTGPETSQLLADVPVWGNRSHAENARLVGRALSRWLDDMTAADH